MTTLVKSLDHALTVLFTIAKSNGEDLTLTYLSKRLALPKANVLRFLHTLEQHGLVARNDKRQVSLGFAAITLGDAFQRGVALGPVSLPYLRELRDVTGETTALQIRLGLERACIQQVESQAGVKWAVEVGRRFPLVSGAAGKVFLAFLSPQARASILQSASPQPLTKRSIVDPKVLERALANVRKDGYAHSLDETVLGASAVAAPVRNHSGEVVAVITVAGPSERLPMKRLVQLARATIECATALSAELAPTAPALRSEQPAWLSTKRSTRNGKTPDAAPLRRKRKRSVPAQALRRS